MNTSWLSPLLTGTYLALLLLPMAAIFIWLKRLKSTRRSPLNQMLLRGPGESLRNEMGDTFGDMMIYVSTFPVLPLLIYAHHISQSYFSGTQESVSRTSVEVLVTLAAIIFLLFKIITLLKRTKNLRLGYEGEVAVAQELNQLMREGAYVFHDVPADGFNIDHVVIWPKGVFAVETKARMKPKRDRGAEDAKVVFDGQRLQFPGWAETAPLDPNDSPSKMACAVAFKRGRRLCWGQARTGLAGVVCRVEGEKRCGYYQWPKCIRYLWQNSSHRAKRGDDQTHCASARATLPGRSTQIFP